LSSNTQKLDLLHEVELAFIDAQAAEATLAIANERLSFARNVSSAVSRRVSAARDPLLASARAEAGVAGSEVEVERASLMASAARSKLASYWSGTSDFKLDHSSFERVDLLPARPNQDSSPDISLLETKRDRAKSGISLETAHAIPDPRLSTGFRQFEDTKDTAWVVGLSVPLPLWDRNSGAIARARAEYASASYEVEAGRRALARQEVALIAERDAAKAEIEALQSRVIPRSEEALSSAREGYASGGLSYLDVLDAQRSLSDAQLRRLSVLTAFHRAQARLARLSGAHSSISSGEEKSR
jgi:cobalt-zinc-cadmium efflux system outer membrane protein